MTATTRSAMKIERKHILLGPGTSAVLLIAGGIVLTAQHTISNDIITRATEKYIDCDYGGLHTNPELKLVIHCGGQKLTITEPKELVTFALRQTPKIRCRKHALGIDNCYVE